jgi:protein-arginine kinase activator protein McsA
MFQHYIKNVHICPICRKNHRNKYAIESSSAISYHQMLIKTSFELERKKYRGLDLQQYIKSLYSVHDPEKV